MAEITKEKLQEFVLTFDDKIVAKLLEKGFERNKHNVFDILNISCKEHGHSNFLAFLMNPNRSGDIGNQFLRNFLALLPKEISVSVPELDFFKMFYGVFEKVIVRREYKKIDILVEIEVLNGKDREKFVIVIENKIYASERVGNKDDKDEGQLVDYRQMIEKEYEGKNYKQLFLFLTPEKRAPEKDKEYWSPIDYDFIYEVLCRLNLDAAEPTTKMLINDYKKIIRSQFEMSVENEKDKELREIALQIYSSAKDVLDFIFTNLPNRVNATADIIRDYLEKKEMVLDGKKQNRFLVFRTDKLKDYPCFYFQVNTKEMKFLFCINDGKEYRKKFEIKNEKSADVTLESYYLFYKKDNKKNAERIDNHEELLLSGRKEEFKDDINRMLEDVFKHEYLGFDKYKEICEKLKEKE